MTIIHEDRTVGEFLRLLEEDTEKVSKHLFNSRWQYRQFTTLKDNPPDNWAAAVQDCSETMDVFIKMRNMQHFIISIRSHFSQQRLIMNAFVVAW